MDPARLDPLLARLRALVAAVEGGGDAPPEAAALGASLRDLEHLQAGGPPSAAWVHARRPTDHLLMVGQLASGLAHDFGNIVTGIALAAEVLLARIAPDDPVRTLGIEIQDAAARARRLIDELLLLSRSRTPLVGTVDLNDAVTRALGSVRRLLPPGIAVETSLAPDLPALAVPADHVERVVTNLAVNARDAMATGGTLRVETRFATDDERGPDGRSAPHVALAVHDTGTGMSPTILARVFEPFFTTKPRGCGTGLGLSTVHAIVEGAGGRIAFDSTPGRGTHVLVLLPAPAPPHPAAPLPPGGARSGPLRVLVVDDEGVIRRTVAAVLRGEGHLASEAADATEALEIVGDPARPLDLLVTDLVMPGMDGRELAARLWVARPALAVLCMSGHFDASARFHGPPGARTGVLRKPFTSADLLRLVAALVG